MNGIAWDSKRINDFMGKHNYIILNISMKNKSKFISFQDKEGYKYHVDICRLFKNNGEKASKFEKRNPYTLENIGLWLKLNNKKFQLCDDSVYINSTKSKIKFFCLVCKEEFFASWACIKSGIGCAICKGRQVGIKTSFGYLKPNLAKEWLYSRNNLTPYQVPKSSSEWVTWKCAKCNYEWEALVYSRSKKDKGCPSCSGRILTDLNRLSVKYVKISLEWDKIKNGNLKPENFSYSSDKKIWWLCSKCNYSWNTFIYSRTLGKHNCPACSQSKGEKEIYNYLNKNNVNFEREYKFDDCLGKRKIKLPFDFYLPDYNLIIEYHGIQHYQSVEFFGGEKRFNERKIVDNIKKKYLKDNNYNFLEISYLDFKNIDKILGDILL